MADLKDPDFWRVKEIYMFTDLYLKRRNDEFRAGPKIEGQGKTAVKFRPWFREEGADLKQCAKKNSPLNTRDFNGGNYTVPGFFLNTNLKWPPLWQEFFVTLNRTRAALKEINQDLSLPDALEVENRALVDVVEDLWFCLCIVFQSRNVGPVTVKRLGAADIFINSCDDFYFNHSIPAILFWAFLYSHLVGFIKRKGADHGMRSQAIDKMQFQAIEKKFEAINEALDLEEIPKDLDLDELYELRPVKHESDKFLGEGVQGKVYKRVLRDEEVAVKEVSRASLKVLVSTSSVAWGSSTSEGAMRDLRLDREVRILDWLKHPNVVELKGVTRRVEGTGKYGLVMELMDKTLEDLISQEVRPLGDVLTIDILLQVARGMRFLHSSNVVHRDLKTSNVLIGLPDPSVPGDALKVKLADFGLAAASSSSEALGDQESPYKMGTSFYMAPELRRHSQAPYTTKADVFSFGSIGFRLGTGMPLDQHHLQLRTQEFYDKIQQGSLSDLLSKCPKYLVPLLERCWSAEPKRRPDFSYICEALLSLKRQALLGLDLVSPLPSNWWYIASQPDLQYIRQLPSDHVDEILQYLGFKKNLDFLDRLLDRPFVPKKRTIFSHKKRCCAIM